MLSILKYALFGGALIGLLFLFNRNGNKTANRLYGVIVILLCIAAFENYLILTRDILDYPHFFSLGSPLLLILPPLFLFLIYSLLDRSYTVSPRKLLLHAIPYLLGMMSLLPLLTLDASIKRELIELVFYSGYGLKSSYPYSAFNIAQFVVYNWFIWKRIKGGKEKRQKKKVVALYQWSHIMYVAINIVIITYIIGYTYFVITAEFQGTFFVIFISGITLPVFYMGIRLLQNSSFFVNPEANYERSTLSEDIQRMLEESFDDRMQSTQPFLDPNISIGDLARSLAVNTHQLSQFINQRKETTFNELINTSRVDYAKELMIKNPDKTMLAIALDSGFNNQESFIRTFKKIVGTTPGKFRSREISVDNL